MTPTTLQPDNDPAALADAYALVSTKSHGYLLVPQADLRACMAEGIRFSRYSYFNQSADLAYLEEDCDAPLFLDWRRGKAESFTLLPKFLDLLLDGPGCFRLGGN